MWETIVGIFAILGTISIVVHAQSEVEIVRRHRSAFSGSISPMQANTLLRRIAAELNRSQPEPRYGILRKTSGNHCGGYACDIICASNGSHWDVFGDGPDGGDNPDRNGAAIPVWAEVRGIVDPSRCELIPASEPVPTPTPQPLPTPTPEPGHADLMSRIETLEAQVEQMRLTNETLVRSLVLSELSSVSWHVRGRTGASGTGPLRHSHAIELEVTK